MSDKRTEERNELFDSAMREKLSGHEPAVPHALWTRISAELNETESNEAGTVPIYREAAVTPRWKIAVAAAVIITIGAGSLLFSFNPSNGINSTPTAQAAPAISTPAVAVPVSETKTVAEAAPVVTKAIATPKKKEIVHTAVAVNITAAPAPENTTAGTEDNQVASTLPSTENNLVELGRIPAYSLNMGISSPVSLNDEIIVIKSATVKKKNRRHGNEETTKVIMLGKKYESQPDIRYQVPVRF